MIISPESKNSTLSLTIPEYFVLHHGQDAEGAECFKLALAELLHHDVFRWAKGNLIEGDRFDMPLSRSLDHIRACWRDRDRPTFGEFAQEVRENLRWPSNRYVIEEVLSVLVEHGLYQPRDYRLFLVLPARCFEPTPLAKKLRLNVQTAIVAERRRMVVGSPLSVEARAVLRLAKITLPDEAEDMFHAFDLGTTQID